MEAAQGDVEMLLVARDHNKDERSQKPVEGFEFFRFYQEVRLEGFVSLANIMCCLLRA